MSFEIEATYENGALKPDKPLPLEEKERVTISIVRKSSRVRQSAGLVPWTGKQEDLDALLGPENQSWDRQ
jgi:predicted DNA-binding antitoxin AbrB/MazE fold protein